MKEVYYTIKGKEGRVNHIKDAKTVRIITENRKKYFKIYYWNKISLKIDKVLVSEVRSLTLYDKNDIYFSYEK